MASTDYGLSRWGDGKTIQFGFRDAKGNHLSVPLTGDQLGSYALGFADFLTGEQAFALANKLARVHATCASPAALSDGRENKRKREEATDGRR